MKRFFLSLVLLSGLAATAQTVINRYAPAGHVLVEKGGRNLSAAFGGGMNTPQVATADLNQDGKQDLVIFEAAYGQRGVKTFINHGFAGMPDFRYEPVYAAAFPEMYSYMILKDYNGDGVADLFHRGLGGFSVSKGYYSGGKLNFRFIKELNYVYTEPGRNPDSTNAYVGGNMIPGIVDVDNDGDLDFLSFSILGSRVLLYKNIQRERGLPNDTIRLVFETGCWGRTYQDIQRTAQMGLDPASQACQLRYIWNPNNQDANGSVSIPGSLAKTAMHGGNTIAMVDIDGDGDQDYLNGNESFNDIQLLINGRNQYGVDSIIAQDTLWQRAGTRYQVSTFPAAFFVDYDGDGKKDILIAPHGSGSQNNKQVWYYQNTGTGATPQFTFKSDSLISDQMIDAGRLSRPLFYDFTKDGKVDLLVGGLEKLATGLEVSRLHLYENITTTVGQPRFRYVTSDLVGLAGLSGVAATDPAVGDVDGDGLDDLVMGRLDGKLVYFRNYASTDTAVPDWRLEEREFTRGGGVVVSVGQNASPALYDVNRDGKEDLVVGQQNGTLTVFMNTNGVSGLASFGAPIANYGNVRVPDASNPPSNFRFSRPTFAKLQAGSTKDYLLLGGYFGQLSVWDSVGFVNAGTTMPLVADSFSRIMAVDYAAPAVADVDGDGKPELVVGSELGGLTLYWTGEGLSVEQTALSAGTVSIYPNPVQHELNLTRSIQSAGEAVVQVLDLTGRVMRTEGWVSGSTTLRIGVDGWATGVYLVLVSGSSGRETHKIQVIR